MKKAIGIIVLGLLISTTSFGHYEGYEKDLAKLSKANTFIDNKGKKYTVDEIKDKKNTLLIIWSTGEGGDHQLDKCSFKNIGYTWEGAPPAAIANLHDKKIRDLTVKIYGLCSGVKGDVKKGLKWLKFLKQKKPHDYPGEYKNVKRQNITLNKIDEFIVQGFENFVLAGHSGGGWLSLNLLSRYPDKIKGVIAFEPAMAGTFKEQKKWPGMHIMRNNEISIITQAKSLKALVFNHPKDSYENEESLGFLKKYNDLKFISLGNLKLRTCQYADGGTGGLRDGHDITGSPCLTKYIEENHLIENYLNSLF